jgi:hypothetical protein
LLTVSDAKRLIHHASVTSNGDKVLILLAIDPTAGVQVAEMKDRAAKAGWPAGARLNISLILSRSGGLAIRTSTGWELSDAGRHYLVGVAAVLPKHAVIKKTSSLLRQHLNSIADPLTKAFAEEAVVCFEAEQYRAAVVFSWAGSIALLHKRVFDQHLPAFNTEALLRDKKWKDAKQQDDLGRMKEKDFLDMCEFLGLVGKNVKQTLGECLNLRNGCGHPNSLQIAEHSVASHIERLIMNVYSKF